MNARERVRQALLCRKPDIIPKALGFFDQSLETIAPTRPENYFNLDVHFVEFDPPDNQDEFRRYMDSLPTDIHVGNQAQLRTYHEWQYHPENKTARPLSSIRSLADLADLHFRNCQSRPAIPDSPNRLDTGMTGAWRWPAHRPIWEANYLKPPGACAVSRIL